MEKHLQENLSRKLEEFSNQANSIEGWLTKEEKKFQAMGVIAPNLEAAMKQKPKVEVEYNNIEDFLGQILSGPEMSLSGSASWLSTVFSKLMYDYDSRR